MELGGQQGEVSQATSPGQLKTPTLRDVSVYLGRKVNTFTAEQEEDCLAFPTTAQPLGACHSRPVEGCYRMTPRLPRRTLFTTALPRIPLSSVKALLLSFISPDLPIVFNTACLSITAVFYYSQITPFCWSNNW